MPTFPSGRLDGKVALVTGASRGIGAAVARAPSPKPARPSPSPPATRLRSTNWPVSSSTPAAKRSPCPPT